MYKCQQEGVSEVEHQGWRNFIICLKFSLVLKMFPQFFTYGTLFCHFYVPNTYNSFFKHSVNISSLTASSIQITLCFGGQDYVV